MNASKLNYLRNRLLESNSITRLILIQYELSNRNLGTINFRASEAILAKKHL